MKTSTKSFLAVATVAVLTIASAGAQVIFNDTFTSGTRQDAGYYITNTSNGAAASVGSGVLNWTKTSSATSDSVLYKNFTSYDLSTKANGTVLQLNLAVTFTTVPVQNNGFRVGLYDFGAVANADATGTNPTNLRSSNGYNFAVGQDSASTQSRLVSFEGSTGGPAGSNTATTTTNIGSGNGFKVNNGNTRYYWLEITKNGANYDVAWLFNNTSNDRLTASTAFSGTGLTPVTNTFDGFAITLVNGGAADYSIDSISLNAIPEPTTWALLAGSLTALMVFRRRRA